MTIVNSMSSNTFSVLKMIPLVNKVLVDEHSVMVSLKQVWVVMTAAGRANAPDPFLAPVSLRLPRPGLTPQHIPNSAAPDDGGASSRVIEAAPHAKTPEHIIMGAFNRTRGTFVLATMLVRDCPVLHSWSEPARIARVLTAGSQRGT